MGGSFGRGIAEQDNHGRQHEDPRELGDGRGLSGLPAIAAGPLKGIAFGPGGRPYMAHFGDYVASSFVRGEIALRRDV